MIDTLRKKLIWICGLSVIVVFAVIFFLIYSIGMRQFNAAMDTLTDTIASGDGGFVEGELPPPNGGWINLITEETPFSTRFFLVRFNDDGSVKETNISSISTVTREMATAYGKIVWENEEERGWIEGYRYKFYQTDRGMAAVFVDGHMNRSMYHLLLVSVGVVLVGSALIILVIIIFFSKRAVKPIAESYQKQKQFVTDANHELKTPLTLILTNLDIVESETGANEWLSDIREETKHLSELVNQMVTLSRMDEHPEVLTKQAFNLSEAIEDVISDFQPLIQNQGKTLHAQIAKGVGYTGDEGAIRQLMGILMDNAVKYCDAGGEVGVTVSERRHPVILVENQYRAVGQIELSKLFDRFYRADKARTFSGGFGIGLSIAREIVRVHHGEISAFSKGSDRIVFKVVLK